ncbi:hypothetical protein CTEN210_00601 [Chaetoceros tenuissimus]|uniref:Uncharacterized protein n=1 Tax=Chaetoceros tenuissimus TaxID=426638 RepID=A0AAD3CDJ5_9STRA|nr:hypothetical protein CTEN210_00601 [Chaetoceros tenuissimus]
MDKELGRDAYPFMTRKQLWLQRAVFDYKQAFKAANNITSNSDCTVIHVRRADVVLDPTSPRKYFPVSDYVKQFFPDLNWKYLDRPRHKGSSGGWENQTPSRNPALEVIILLATYELAQECSAIVWGASGFADLILNQMQMANSRNKVESYRVEGTLSVHNETYKKSESELQKNLEALRNKAKIK